ncbi:MAG: GNAT family N-acetyltransferase [Planctomycetaceae bacterium]|jgi:GNAT superfamily N-acetyltransferase|nr:GNAT family N-acetyltransferase [Planctomycetaceae bacterium]
MLAEELEISDWRISYGRSELEYEIDGDYAHVQAINAEPKGCGIGTLLCQKFEDIAKSEGCKVIEVPVSLTSEALCFWRAMGYELRNKSDQRKMKRIIETDMMPRDDPQGVIVMQKRLAG